MDELADEPDIRNGEGALIGGVRRVGKDGTLRFDHARWTCPADWAGERVFVHVHITHRDEWKVEAAPPGVHIYDARERGSTIQLVRATARTPERYARRPVSEEPGAGPVVTR